MGPMRSSLSKPLPAEAHASHADSSGRAYQPHPGAADPDPPPFRALFFPMACGLFFLLWGLDLAILAGDELHLIRALTEASAWELLTTFRSEDHCRPLAALFSYLHSSGVPLDGWTLRLPSLACVAALMVVAPLWVHRRLGPRPALAMAWLLATSPLIILYGRIVRPYSMILLLVPASLCLFLAWERERRPPHLLAHALLGASAVLFHPVVTPAVLAPGLYALHRAMKHRSWRPFLRALPAPALVGLGITAVVWPAWPSLRALVAEKVDSPPPSLETQWHAAQSLLGTPSSALTVILGLLVLLGARSLSVRQPRLAALAFWSSLAQVVGLWILRPSGYEAAIPYGRYLIGLLPGLLLCLALGWCRLTDSWPRWWRVCGGLASILLLLGVGPLLREPFILGSFAHHKDVVGFFAPPARLSAPLADGYLWLNEQADRAPIVEAPALQSWRRNRALYAYQSRHRRAVSLAIPKLVLPTATELPGAVAAETLEDLCRVARYLVLHHDLGAEDEALSVELRSPASTLSLRAPENAAMRTNARSLLDLYRRSFGKPAFSDATLSIWDFERLPRSAPCSPHSG